MITLVVSLCSRQIVDEKRARFAVLCGQQAAKLRRIGERQLTRLELVDVVEVEAHAVKEARRDALSTPIARHPNTIDAACSSHRSARLVYAEHTLMRVHVQDAISLLDLLGHAHAYYFLAR